LIGTNTSALGSNGGLTVNNGANFSYRPTAPGALNLGTGAINLATGSTIGTAIAGTAEQSAITSSVGATTAGSVTVNIYGIPGGTVATGANNLIIAANGLNGATYALGKVFNNTNFTVSGLTDAAGSVSINVASATALGNAYWKGTSVSGLPGIWAASDGSANSNWVSTAGGSAQALVPGPAANVFISANTPLTSSPTNSVLGANMSINSLTIQDTTNGLSLNADGNTLTIEATNANGNTAGAGITMNSSVPASTIAANVALGANQTWTNNSTNALTVSGIVSGAFNLTVAGSGTTALSGLNTYSGGTTVSSGVLLLGNLYAAQDSIVTISAGMGTLGTNNGLQFKTGLGSDAFTIGGLSGATNEALLDTGGSAVALTIGNDNNTGMNYSGILSGGGSLIKIGTGTQTLSGPNTYTGTTSVTGGTLILAGSLAGSTVSISGVGTLTESAGGVIAGTGSAFTQGSTGTSTLSGANTYTGTTTVSAGTLAISGAGTLGATTAPLTVSGGTLDLGTTTQTVGAVSISAAATSGNTIQNGSLTGASYAASNGSGNAIVTANLLGSGIALTKSGAGTLTLSGANTYGGGTTVSAGTLIGTNSSALGAGALKITAGNFSYRPTTAGALTTGTLTLATGDTIGTAIAGTAGQSAIVTTGSAVTAGAVTVNIYGIPGGTVTTGANNLITAGNGLTGATSYTLGKVFNDTNFTVTGLTDTATAVSITVANTSALTSAYWEGSTVSGVTGIWAASNGLATGGSSNWVSTAGGSAQALVPGPTANVFISGNTPLTSSPTNSVLGANMSINSLTIQDTTNGLSLSADGNTLTIEAGSGTGITMNSGVPASTIAAPVALGANQTWTNNSTTGALTVSGVVSGASSLTTAGAGTTVLSGANTYSGGTIVSSGTLQLSNGSGSATGSGSVSVANNAAISGAGIINPTGASTVNIASGGIIVAGGISGSSATPGLTINAAGNTVGAGFVTVSGAVFNIYLGASNSAGTLNLTNSFASEVSGLGGNTFNFTDLTAGSLAPGEYTLIQSDDSASNPFTSLTPGTLTGFTLNGLSAYSGAGDTVQLELNQVASDSNDYAIQLDILTAVPEPSTWAMLFAGTVMLVCGQRTRRRY
jgi:autotransporter-associated beta strand protein